ncbi:YybH family protein [Mycobacteroides franklinii]|uniref:SnoaL-like domain protein n=1 Tax=Mycobacteroides franklinii TaxID=948102 RepID=A0A4V3HUR4_9MYCO|nr:nuclear transport factor 2 family protein [Mycobacteroides franklinii]TDZ45783.1 SnoaL-like domain protein [Mycobacteroides franklinii]TDZ49273.1 SnoaL-like domain protein [Mycobacteroides franklinii]TDZ59453.1 SnoaL-like domain protein [Mycobacteroides franklinii]TDZ66968.1 SnoaL-like domain protein [Mycobacteroides franklinii]TDZ72892.1 SnoaL-like domain protein [Mycobacteroides franklinii]
MTLPELPQYVADFLDAVNRHDEAALLDSFSPDGFVDDWGRVFTGREAIKGWSDKQLIGAGGTISPEKVRYNGDAVIVTGDYRSERVNGLFAFTFRRDGDKLASVKIRTAWRVPRFVSGVLERFRQTPRASSS